MHRSFAIVALATVVVPLARVAHADAPQAAALSTAPPTAATAATVATAASAPGTPTSDALPGLGGRAVGLRELQDRFWRENLQVHAARLGVEATRADIIAAGVLTNPNLALNGSWHVQGAATGADQSYSITVDQVIPIAGQIGLRKEVATGLANAAERDLAMTVFSLAADVRDAYLDLQVAQARYRSIANGLHDLDHAEAVVAQRAAAGANPAYDLTRVDVEQSAVTGQLADARADLATARAALAKAVGKSIDPATLVVEDGVPDAPDPPTDLDALVARAIKQRPDLLAARQRAESADTRVRQTKREYVPSPDLALGYQPWFHVQQSDGSYANGGAIYAGVSVPLPLWDHGQGKVDRALAEASQARVLAEASDVAVRFEVQRAVEAMRTRVTAWRVYRDTTAGQVEKLRAMAETAYREGKSGILELLDAHRAYLEAHLREIELRAGATQAGMDLERAVGPER